MIVIATYNDIKILSRLLDSMNTTNNLDEDVLIVCTNDTQHEMIKYIYTLPSNPNYNYRIKVDVTPYKGYDSGAYIYAYKKYVDDYYIFLQDSIEIYSPEWFNAFKARRSKNKITAWMLMPNPMWLVNQQLEWVITKCGECAKNLKQGIIGPIFQVDRKSLMIMDEKYNLDNCIPTNKLVEQQGMERHWACMAENSGIEMDSIEQGWIENWDQSTQSFHKVYIKKYIYDRA
jgi:hypothetical protein